MHLHSVRLVACCVRGSPFSVRACVVWLHDLCAVWLHDLCAVWLYLWSHDSCAVCSYTTRVRCVRDEDRSRRLRSCTVIKLGRVPHLKPRNTGISDLIIATLSYF